ncbi:MAG: Yop proteins translocation protein K [Chthoniobacterales bacterium]|nr:Yop proteins translocation protein K [Chthoniobacterales bacterium]
MSIGENEIRAWLEKETVAPLIEEWICWNNSPLRHVPLGTLTQFFPEKFYHSFLEEPRVRATVDALLKKKLSWNESVSWVPHDFLWNIGMIAPGRLKRLVLLASASLFFREIAQIIDGALIRSLREELGEDLLQFVVLSGSSARYALEPMREELLHNTPAAFQESSKMRELLHQGSIKLADHAFSLKEQGIQKRIATKLPGCFAQGCAPTPLPWALEAEAILNKLWNETSSWI